MLLASLLVLPHLAIGLDRASAWPMTRLTQGASDQALAPVALAAKRPLGRFNPTRTGWSQVARTGQPARLTVRPIAEFRDHLMNRAEAHEWHRTARAIDWAAAWSAAVLELVISPLPVVFVDLHRFPDRALARRIQPLLVGASLLGAAGGWLLPPQSVFGDPSKNLLAGAALANILVHGLINSYQVIHQSRDPLSLAHQEEQAKPSDQGPLGPPHQGLARIAGKDREWAVLGLRVANQLGLQPSPGMPLGTRLSLGHREYTWGHWSARGAARMVRVGPLFFIDRDLYELRLNPELKTKIGANAILINDFPTRHISNTALLPLLMPAILQTMHQHVQGHDTWSLLAGDGTLALVAAKRGSEQVHLISDSERNAERARTDLALNGYAEESRVVIHPPAMAHDRETLVHAMNLSARPAILIATVRTDPHLTQKAFVTVRALMDLLPRLPGVDAFVASGYSIPAKTDRSAEARNRIGWWLQDQARVQKSGVFELQLAEAYFHYSSLFPSGAYAGWAAQRRTIPPRTTEPSRKATRIRASV